MAVYNVPWSAAADSAGGKETSPLKMQLSDIVIARNAKWFVQVRWIVIAVLLLFQAVSVLLRPFLESLGFLMPVNWPLPLAIILLCTNAVFEIGNRWIPKFFSPSVNIWTQILTDLICLTVAVHFLGSTGTPAVFLFSLHIVLSCIFFRIRSSFAVLLTATFLYCFCIAVEYAGLFPPTNLFAKMPDIQANLSLWVIVFQILSIVALFFVLWYVVSRLSQIIRTREDQLIKTDCEIQSMQREKEKHSVQTAHQLKAPLDVIRSKVFLLKDGYCGPVTEAIREVMEVIDKRAASMGKQILDVLQLTKLDAPEHQNQEFEEISIGNILRNCIAEYSPVVGKRNISLVSQIEEFKFQGHADQIQLMLGNILQNAINYSYENGSVEITCTKEENSSGCLVRIADHGIGIAPQKLPMIFNEYYRTNEAAKHNPASSGIGLAIVKKIAQSHQVGLQVESEENKGTIMILHFPEGITGRENRTSPEISDKTQCP